MITVKSMPIPHSRPLLFARLALCVVVFLTLPVVAGAQAPALPIDELLLSRSSVVVFGEVRSAGVESPGDQSFTDSVLEVEDVPKGYVASRQIVVRHPGGPGGRVDGKRLSLAEGDRVLLFLGAEENDVYPISEYPFGMFWEARMGGRSLLLGWGVAAGDRVPTAGELDSWLRPRDATRFRQWIADRVAGAEPPATYFSSSRTEGPVGAPSADNAPCTPTSDVFQLDGGYRVRLCYRTPQGDVGQGRSGIWASGQAGLFWFFDRGNPEALIKVVDGCAFNQHRWVFFAPVSDLGLHLQVIGRNKTWTYTNPVGRTAPTAADTAAFFCADEDGGGTSGPDLVVESPSVDKSEVDPNEFFTIRVRVVNQGNATAGATTLRYYRSSDSTISRSDFDVGTDPVGALAAGRRSTETGALRAPSTSGTYYYGACVDPVSGEGNTGNNCSSGVRVTVRGGGASKIYWVDTGRGVVRRSNPDGTNVESFLATARGDTYGLAIDADAGKVYFGDHGRNKVLTANLDGSGLRDFADVRQPEAMAVDANAGKVYFGGEDGLYRADMDGSDVERLVSGARVEAMVLDPVGGKVYWANRSSGADRVRRANLNGTGVEDVVTGLNHVEGIALAVRQRKVYWSDARRNRIQRANLDGTGVEDVVTGLPAPQGLAIDEDQGVIYWGDVSTDRIRRANLDGSNVRDVVTAAGDPQAVALLHGAVSPPPPPPTRVSKIYWVDTGRGVVRRSNPDGTNVESFLATARGDTYGLAIDADAGKVYFGDHGRNKILTANLDGSGLRDFVNVRQPEAMAVDANAGKVYFGGEDGLYRADMDGSDVERLVSGARVEAMVLDPVGGKVYWANRSSGADRVRRANLNGTGVEDVVTGLNHVEGIALAVRQRKVYWSDARRNRIQRANLDGTGVEDVVTGLPAPQGLAIDEDQGVIYWGDVSTDRIRRANLDGSNVRDVVTAAGDPQAVALLYGRSARQILE